MSEQTTEAPATVRKPSRRLRTVDGTEADEKRRYVLAGSDVFEQRGDALYSITSDRGPNGEPIEKATQILPGALEVVRAVAMVGVDPDRRPSGAGDEDQAVHLIYRPRRGGEVAFRYVMSDALESRPKWWIQGRIAASTSRGKLPKVDNAVKAMLASWEEANGGWMNGYTSTGLLLRDGAGPVFLRDGAGALTPTGVDESSRVELPDGFENNELRMDDPSTDEQFPADLSRLLRILDTTPKEPEVSTVLLGMLAWAPWGNLHGHIATLIDGEPGIAKTSLCGLAIEAQSNCANNWRGSEVKPTAKIRDNGSSAVGLARRLAPFGGALGLVDDGWNGLKSEREIQQTWNALSTTIDNMLSQSSGDKGRKESGSLRAQEFPRCSVVMAAEKVPNLRQNVSTVRRMILLHLSHVDLSVMDEIRGDETGTGSRMLSRAHARMVQLGLADMKAPARALSKARAVTGEWRCPAPAASVAEWYARALAGVMLTADAVRTARAMDPAADLPDPDALVSRAVEVLAAAFDRQTFRGGWRGSDARAGTPLEAWLRALREMWTDGVLWVASGAQDAPYLPPTLDTFGGPGRVGWTQGGVTSETGDTVWLPGRKGSPCGFYGTYGGRGRKTFDHMLRVKATDYRALHDTLDAHSQKEHSAPLPTPEEMLAILDAEGVLASARPGGVNLTPKMQQKRAYTFDLSRILEGLPEDDDNGGQEDGGPEAPEGPQPPEDRPLVPTCHGCGLTFWKNEPEPSGYHPGCDPAVASGWGPGTVGGEEARTAAAAEPEQLPEDGDQESAEAAPAAAPSVPAPRPKPQREPQVCASIADRVAAALEKAGGDTDKATAALIKSAIPDGMELLESTRVSARYDFTAHPPEPSILRKPSKNGANEVWEARPKWTNPATPDGTEIQLLDVNAAYLSALNTHLPIGALQHSEGGEFDRRRSGLYLITPPEWTHTDIPNPLGARELSGDLWVTRPTLQLLLDAASEKYGSLCAAPVIHESWTSGSSESILRAFRLILRDARTAAIEGGDAVTLAYVKAMYSKFISTSAKASKFNHLIERTDWSQIIRAQAHGNLWRRALKAHKAGLTVHRITGTDELHVAGDWRAVFPEGRGLTEMKTKGAYIVGAPVTETGE